jgi:hypothetical protein
MMFEPPLTLDETWRTEARDLNLTITKGRPEWDDTYVKLTDRENLEAARLLMARLWPTDR